MIKLDEQSHLLNPEKQLSVGRETSKFLLISLKKSPKKLQPGLHLLTLIVETTSKLLPFNNKRVGLDVCVYPVDVSITSTEEQ